jgi:ACT domain-containing protein
MLTEEVIRSLTLEAIEQLGPQATTANVQRVVRTAAARLEGNGDHPAADAGRIIVTAYGVNRPGIIASITGVLARHECDILDMTQKLLQEYFTLMMIVDVRNARTEFTTIHDELAALGDEHGMRILVQHEDVFNAMHRI